MMYGNYSEGGYSGNYGRRGVPGTGRGRGRGRYSAGGQGGYSTGGYSGQEPMEEMMEHYGNYSEAREAANMGNYGAEGEAIKCLEYMLNATCQFFEMLDQEAGSPEEKQLIKKYARKIGEM